MIWHRISEQTMREVEAEHAVASAKFGSYDRDWSPDRFRLGSIAERLVAHRLGVERKQLIGDGADGGADFSDVDVKGRPVRSHHLMRLATDPLKATWYVVVLVDLENLRAGVRGHTHVSELRAAPIEQRRGGPTRCLPYDELADDLPPHLYLRRAL